jgi:D-3-phosphoglycerate dehydrogenase
MKVIANSTSNKTTTITLPFYNGTSIDFNIETQTLDTVLKEADFISLHVPKQDNYLISQHQIDQMKKGVGIVNTACGGVIDEVALINAIEAEQIKYAALDVFENEPKPEIQILMNPEISLTPHIGGATIETQERIAVELAQKIIIQLT